MSAVVEPRPRDSHVWARDALDWYIEPQWCSARLFEEEEFCGLTHDPACGSGRIVVSAAEARLRVTGSDVVSRSVYCDIAVDFLCPEWVPALEDAMMIPPANIVSNPPFRHATAFVELSLTRATRKVAMLLPTKWLHGDKRSRWLETLPLRRVLCLTPRPSMPPGAVVMAGEKVGGGKEDFAWFIFEIGFRGRPEIGWLRREK